MGNMSYCRFRNTLSSLQDCKDSWHELTAEDQEEQEARDKILELCQEIAEENS